MAEVSVHLDPGTLASVREGRFNFLQVVFSALKSAGLEAIACGEDEAPAALSLWHMTRPDLPGALIFRRTYHVPFWHIEREVRRWHWPVAQATFDPDAEPIPQARAFTRRLAARVLPGGATSRKGPLLVALQGRLTEARSFQTMSPLEMVEAVGASGRPAVVTLHPREALSGEERAGLREVLRRHPSLAVGTDSAALLRHVSAVVTQNSAVAFDGLILDKPAVLFGQIDFHHIALKVAEIGAQDALARAARFWPPTARYVAWFLRQAIDARAPDAEAQVLAALRRGGWPV